MRKLLFESLFRRPFTEQAPSTDDAAVTELAMAVGLAARRRLGRSLSIREVDAGSCNGCELEIHALNNAYYDVERFGLRFVASPDGNRTGHEEHARRVGAHLSCDPQPEMGRRRGRLRPGWRLLCRQLRGGRRSLASGSRRSSYSRLSTAAHQDLAGAALSARSNG